MYCNTYRRAPGLKLTLLYLWVKRVFILLPLVYLVGVTLKEKIEAIWDYRENKPELKM